MKIRLKRIFTIGVLPEQSFNEKRDIIFLNQANFVLILCMISIFMANIGFGFYNRSLVSLSLIPFLSIAIIIQKWKQYSVAKILTIVTVVSGSFLTAFLFGGEAKAHYYMFPSFCLSIVLFSRRSYHIISSLSHLAVFSILLVFLKENASIFSGQDTILLSYFHIPLMFFCIFIVLSEYVVHYKRYEKRINELMTNLKENGELLEIEKTKFEVQTEILRMTNDRLVKEVDNKEEIEDKLIESNKSLEQFAYVASHDLKEPLRTIGSFSQLLKRKLDGKLDNETGEYFHFIIDGVQRMSKLLDDLLAFSRLNSSQFETLSVDLNNCLELNKLNLRNAIEKNNGMVVVDEMPMIKANRSQMNQLFQNLISNGLKFRREVAPFVKVACEEKTDHYLFSVEDNGIGIDEKYLEKVFVIFQRLDKKACYEGTGIGLAICRKIVENHGGKIWVESVVGEGTTFFFTLPKTGEGFIENDEAGKINTNPEKKLKGVRTELAMG